MKKHSLDDRIKMNRQFEHVLKQDFNGASIGNVKQAINMALGPLPYINWSIDKSCAVVRAKSRGQPA